ncbi:hypothetical protein MYAM1_000290 [Malassezia yamatoensis]|uniref:Uncharacterized protein n=1 Tax=Malassezia yamatoensis TaxID=253288 RepID=A0AAJ5YP18_9BASI|nr:hypothetical protein MYAM1_000290 [Malassezia yamatoensis]
MASTESSARLSRLLQRTRISTYDPKVERVYTAPIAHAARGDWGIKRTMPSSWQSTPDMPAPAPYAGALRYATLRELDTKQGLTDWKENERDPLFRRRWLEAGARLSDRSKRDGLSTSVSEEEINVPLGLRPRIAFDSATHSKQAPPAHVVWGTNHAKYTTTPDVLPNYNAMSQRDFDRFLHTVRRQRSKFRSALRKQRKSAAEHTVLERLTRKHAKDNAPAVISEEEYKEACADLPTPKVDLWDEARLAHAPQTAANFFSARAQEQIDAPRSRALGSPAYASALHPLLGLQYSQPDSVYTHLLAEPIHGHAISRVEDARRSRYFVGSDTGLAIAAGGHISHLPLQHRQGLDAVDYTRAKPERGVGYFRVLHAFLDLRPSSYTTRRTPPNVAPTEPNLGYVRSQLMALPQTPQATPPTPGSSQWVDDPVKDAQAQKLRSHSLNRNMRSSVSETDSLFGSLAKNNRNANPNANRGGKRQRFQKKKREAPSTQKDVQMLDNIKNLLSPQ